MIFGQKSICIKLLVKIIIKNDTSSHVFIESDNKPIEKTITNKVELKKHPQLNERYTFENNIE